MNRYKLSLVTLLLCTLSHGQNTLSEADFTGTWKAKISESRIKSMDMMFDGSTITINSDGTYTGNVMQEISGNWILKDGSIFLKSEALPFPLQLSDCTKDSCTWKIDEVNASIPFFKMNHEENNTSTVKDITYIDIGKEDIQGEWINTHAEVVGRSTKQNIFFFGDSELNDKLILDQSSQFLMSGTSVKQNNEVLKGSWTVEDGVVTYTFESGESKRLGITKYTGDSLVLEDLEERTVPMIGQSKIRFIYTKELAAGLKKYRIKPEVLDTFQVGELKIALTVPKDFQEFYDIENRTVVVFFFSHCSWCSRAEDEITSIREELQNSEKLVRFLDSPESGMIIHEGKTHITDNIYYEMEYVFNHEEEVYKIMVSSFLEENVRILAESLADMKIISP